MNYDYSTICIAKIYFKIIKRSLLIIVCILLLSLIITSCDILNSDKKQNEAKLHGSFYDVFLSDTSTVIPEEVYLDGQLISPDSLGQYLFKLSKGGHTISAESDYHSSFDSTFTVDSLNQSVSFKLDPITDDYFPLKVGMKWEYEYENRYRTPDYTDYRTLKTGSLTYEVIKDSLSTSQDTIYKVKADFAGILIQNSYTQPVDTSQVLASYYVYFTKYADQSIQSSFLFLPEDADQLTGYAPGSIERIRMIHFSNGKELPYSGYPLTEFPNSRSKGKTISFYNAFSAFQNFGFEKNIGLSFYSYNSGGHNVRSIHLRLPEN